MNCQRYRREGWQQWPAESAERVTAADRSGPLVAALRDAIVDGEFAPNQRLVEADLSERFGASRGNVRSALLELTAEGLVERVQNRGARVRAISLTEAIEITEVRMVAGGPVRGEGGDAADRRRPRPAPRASAPRCRRPSGRATCWATPS